MKIYDAKDIRNVAVAGHASKGKTTLTEAMLYIAGATERMGRVADGNTVTDYYDSEEKKRTLSTSSAVAPVEYNSKRLILLILPVFLILPRVLLRD